MFDFSLKRKFEYAGQINPSRVFDIDVRTPCWPVLFSDEYFLPRLTIKLKNQGPVLGKGSLELYIVDFESIGQIGSVTSYNGFFQDIYHHPIENHEPGETLKLKVKIKSKFLKPGRYILRAVLTEWKPSGSIIFELQTQAKSFPVDKREDLFSKVISNFKSMGVDVEKDRPGQFSATQIFDLRFIEIIKVHPLTTVVGVFGAFLAVFSAVFIPLLKILWTFTDGHW